MSSITHRRAVAGTLRTALGAAALTGCMLLPAAAQATRAATTTCRGGLTKDAKPTSNDPHLLDYSFHCSQDITAYSIIVNRGLNDFGTIDDFNVAPSVYDVQNGQKPYAISTTQTVDCTATTTPGNAINCFAIGPKNAAQTVFAYDFVQGTIDTTDPFCGSVSKKGKVTPPASAQLIVSDVTGAEFGPFDLALPKACPKLTAPAKKSKPAKSKAGKKRKKSTPGTKPSASK